ncbi:fibronectin type III domain-containing protein [Mycolicibacterium palauense]|uniref:fibronectin type III domain-containing protein n=1 Tax=Mycolicibacterium palauense TaxID=2034511 RepID=UPI0011460368|nr:fibronectin type III domain-containing protein [Mycolicibacterium palauense]
MTRPATGGVRPSFDEGFDAASARKALDGYMLLRDQDGVNTSMAFVEVDGDWVSGFNPFAQDGQIRQDFIVEQGGTWYNLGGGESSGPKFGNSFEVKKERFWQTRQVIRTDITSEEGTVEFGMGEYSSLSDTLEMDLPLLSTPVKGTKNYARKRPIDFDGRPRQGIVYTRDKGGVFTADLFPNLSIENIEDRELSAENLIASIFRWGVSIDAHSGFSHARFRSGPGWEGNPGPPKFSAAPAAAEGAGGAVTIVFPAPVGPATPFTYTVRKTHISDGVVTDLATTGPSVTDGVVTLSGTGLDSGEEFSFQVHAANAAGKVSISRPSNVITALA